jgi:proteic killer suppression protein
MFADGDPLVAFHGFARQASKRLDILDAATSLEDLRALPSNRLEALRGDRAGQFCIRINNQWRICFEWPAGAAGPSNVEIVDYH